MEHIHGNVMTSQELVAHVNELVDANKGLLISETRLFEENEELTEENEELTEENEELSITCNKWLGILGISMIGNFFFLLERFL